MEVENWRQELAEYAYLHNEDCCVHSEGGCDAGIGELECCRNMQMLDGYVSEIIKSVTIFISHDMDFENEEQRKEAVKMYLKDTFLLK